MKGWRGLILAGGTGSRLAPLTQAVNKHLLPVYDKPMIYYPLSVLMLSGVRDVTVLTTSASLGQFKALLGDGSHWGITVAYCTQDEPRGIADGLRLAGETLAGHPVVTILGDNIFHGAGIGTAIQRAAESNRGATIFSYEVSNPSAFGVVTLDQHGSAVALEEKPANPKSRRAVTGLYLYDADVFERAQRLTPSARGELEVTDLNRSYLDSGQLDVVNFGRGTAWLDGGTLHDLYEAGHFVRAIQERTGLRIACPEEIAFRQGYIDRAAFTRLVDRMGSSDYGGYLKRVLEDPVVS